LLVVVPVAIGLKTADGSICFLSCSARRFSSSSARLSGFSPWLGSDQVQIGSAPFSFTKTAASVLWFVKKEDYCSGLLLVVSVISS
jgi:hypothetical protein